MTDDSEVARIAAGLTKAQRAYLDAVYNACAPYEPRHGRTANWALRHGYAQTIVRIGDRTGGWDDFSMAERFDPGIDEILGQTLTPLGLRVKAYLESKGGDA